MGVRNGKRKTGKRRFVQTKRSRFSSKSLLNLSLSRLRARFPAPATTTRSTPRTRARKRETERFATSKKRYPAAFLERLWFHAHSFRRDLKRRRRQERRRMVEASEKRTLTTTHQKQDLRVFLPQPQRGEDVVKPIERPHVSICGGLKVLRCNRSGSNLHREGRKKKKFYV